MGCYSGAGIDKLYRMLPCNGFLRQDNKRKKMNIAEYLGGLPNLIQIMLGIGVVIIVFFILDRLDSLCQNIRKEIEWRRRKSR